MMMNYEQQILELRRDRDDVSLLTYDEMKEMIVEWWNELKWLLL